MKTTAPYIIRHVQLDQFPEKQPFDLEPGQGYFFSCWWRTVPLGQFFVEHQDRPDQETLEKKMLDAIEPAIKGYLAGAGMAQVDCRTSFLQKRFNYFSLTIDTALAEYRYVEPVDVDVSVIICTRNRSADLKRCLQSLAAQVCRPREIIVVDNAPSDDTTRQVVETFPGVIYCREPRGGLSIARNAGLKRATGEVVAFTDDDVSLHPLWLYHVWDSFLQPGMTAMTGLVIPAALDTESQQLFEKEWSFNCGFRDKIYDDVYFKTNLATGPRVWEIGAGANMAFRRTVFDRAGYFDERLGAGAAGCSEDSEMWYRILAAGLRIKYNPRAVVYHEHRKEMTALRKQLFSYMRGHTAAALIQQRLHREAGYRRYLYRKIVRSYLPRMAKTAFRYPSQYKMLQLQVRGIFSGVLFFIRNRNRPPQTNFY